MLEAVRTVSGLPAEFVCFVVSRVPLDIAHQGVIPSKIMASA